MGMALMSLCLSAVVGGHHAAHSQGRPGALLEVRACTHTNALAGAVDVGWCVCFAPVECHAAGTLLILVAPVWPTCAHNMLSLTRPSPPGCQDCASSDQQPGLAAAHRGYPCGTPAVL